MSLPILINQLYEAAIAYEGRVEVGEEETARRKARTADRKRGEDEESDLGSHAYCSQSNHDI